ncbi:MAG: DUF4129 domain-containing protein [Gemmatimonadales bacterium]|nr:DUF4129 domain-containing protein [Gemmatimonadales bacterium]
MGDVFARPEYQWVERRRPLLWLRNLWRSLLDWVNGLADNHPLGFNLLLWVAVILLLLLLVHIGYVLWRIVQPTARTPRETGTGKPVLTDAAAHLARAAELARAGRFAEALGHRFLAVVLELERREALRFHASKTPAEYVGELRLDETGRATFAGLVGTLYRHLFGAVPCDEGEYRAFGATADDLTTRSHVVPA